MTVIQKISLDNPILIGIALFLIALIFRMIDIFILRLDERLGEIILSKILGSVLVIVFVWSTGHTLKDIGFHTKFLSQSLFIGVLVTAIGLVAGYGVEFIIARQRGIHPELLFVAIDPKANVSGGVLFALWLLVGNFVNSFMEEGLFRGILIRLFSRVFAFWPANMLQALLFGVWHLPWVVKNYLKGELDTTGKIAFSTVSNFLPQFVLGLVWGFLYLKTNSLWSTWISHTLTNSAINFLHIKTDEGLDSGIAIRMTTFTVVMVINMVLINRLAYWFQLPAMKPWGE